MPKRKRGQSERRRRKKQRARRAESTSTGTRPLEWARQELAGIEDYIRRLEGPLGERLPEKWVAGQLRHYRARCESVRAEILAIETTQNDNR